MTACKALVHVSASNALERAIIKDIITFSTRLQMGAVIAATSRLGIKKDFAKNIVKLIKLSALWISH